jgi:CRP-like cAMP-binding protein
VSIKDEISILRDVAPFSTLDNKRLKLLAFMSTLVDYSAGATVVRQGEAGDSVFVLIDGLVEASIARPGQPPLICEMGEHAFFGEIAVMRGRVRAATVTAKTHLLVLKISRDVLQEMIEAEPELGRRIDQHIEKAGYTFS